MLKQTLYAVLLLSGAAAPISVCAGQTSLYSPSLTNCPGGRRLVITPLRNGSADLEIIKPKVGLLKITRVEELTGDCAKSIVQSAGGFLKDEKGKVFSETSERQYDEHAFLPEERVVSIMAGAKNRTGSTDVNVTSLFEITRWVGSASSFDLTYVAVARGGREWYIGRVRKSTSGQIDFTKFAKSKYPIRSLGDFPGEHDPIGTIAVLQEINPGVKRVITVSWIRGPTTIRPDR